MSNDNKLEVEIKSDQGSESFGNNAYNAAVDGDFDSKWFRSSALVMFGTMVMIFAGMLFSKNSGRGDHPGRALSAPGVSLTDNSINPKLLTQRDLTNLIRRPNVEISVLGKIRVVNLRSISELPIGSEMRAVLESGATDGIVKAKLTAPLLVDGEPLLPDRAVLFGKGKSGEERLYVEFSKVIFPSGESFSIRAQAFDVSDKIQGLKGALVGTRAKKMAGAITFGFLGGMTGGLQTNTSGSYFSNQKPSTRDAALAGASKAALDQSQAYIEDMKKSPNIIEVKAGSEIVVITDEPKSKKEDSYEEK